MPLYRVRWEIDLDAETPRHAAMIALDTQCDPDSLATVYTVQELDDSQTAILSETTVDLGAA